MIRESREREEKMSRLQHVRLYIKCILIISALYEDESDSDIGSMENHGSVVTHLLSQVKIGMDLTKVMIFLSMSMDNVY